MKTFPMSRNINATSHPRASCDPEAMSTAGARM